jgi:hypothetical protein
MKVKEKHIHPVKTINHQVKYIHPLHQIQECQLLLKKRYLDPRAPFGDQQYMNNS